MSMKIIRAAMVAFTAACGVEPALEEHRDLLTALECGDTCVDPAPVSGGASTGGGAGVGTSSSAAASDAKKNAENSACNAAKVGLTAPACPDAANCSATSTITCAYTNMRCPVVGTFGGTPRDWVQACRLSKEDDAWKAANCNLRNGPGGKPSFVLCTVDATATASTDCEPKVKTCESGELPVFDLSHRGLRDSSELSESGADAADCAAGHCDPQLDTKAASGRGTAISTTATGAVALADDNAKTDAELNAAAKLVIPACADGCKPFGAPSIVYSRVAGGPSCTEGRFDRIPGPEGQPDADTNGIGDWWAWACTRQAGHSVHEPCDSAATGAAKPFYAWCFANATATGTQLCVDKNSTCADAVATADAFSSATSTRDRGASPP